MASANTETVSSALISHALEVAGRLANEAAEVIAATAGRSATPGAKAHPFDWVTETDRALERHTRRVLASTFPGAAVLGEEFGGTASVIANGPDPGADHGTGTVTLPGEPNGPDLLWIVDPVDGTANYVAGLPWCCYSLALVDASGPLVGVIADPNQGQIYAAARGRGIRANGSPIPPSPVKTLAGSLLMVEPNRPERSPDTGALLARCRSEHVGPRILGSSALAIVQVVLGRAAAAVLPEGGYRVWDVAGALALAAESGLDISDLAGVRQSMPLDGLVVSAPEVADDVLALLTSG